jgi:hypothetical protein
VTALMLLAAAAVLALAAAATRATRFWRASRILAGVAAITCPS